MHDPDSAAGPSRLDSLAARSQQFIKEPVREAVKEAIREERERMDFEASTDAATDDTATDATTNDDATNDADATSDGDGESSVPRAGRRGRSLLLLLGLAGIAYLLRNRKAVTDTVPSREDLSGSGDADQSETAADDEKSDGPTAVSADESGVEAPAEDD